MAHYAKVNQGLVEKVIVAEAEFFNTFVDSTPGEWIQTSYNTRGGVHYQPNSNTPSDDQSKALRKNFAGVGYHYDGTGFYAPQPFPSWTFNNTTYEWECSVTYPDDGQAYEWNETTKQWDLVT
jgi:hypothetical protein|tara:strand:+ start:10010 stop:10378 length:369 start_codon:yes stop_codon:yes gene_type:complete